MNLIVLPCVVSPSMTKDCMRSLLAQDIGDVRVLAIDNGSSDGVGSWLRSQQDERVQVISYAPRKSLNKVWNNALRLAFERWKLEYVLVVNNDTVLMPEAYRLLRDDGGWFVTCVGVAPGQALTIGDLSEHRPHPDFSCFLMRRECWEKVGEFDEEINAFYGDNDYHIRMHRAGVRAYCLQVPFTHIASGTLKNASNELRDQIQREAGEDRERFKRRYGFLPTDKEYEMEFKR